MKEVYRFKTKWYFYKNITFCNKPKLLINMVAHVLSPMANQPTKGLTRGGDLREAQVDVPSSV
jgi:hypothetical protein